IVLRGAENVDELLVLSQVVLSLQLSFAVIPLVTFTSDRSKMGTFANPLWVVILAVVTTAIIVALNANLAIGEIAGWFESAGNAWWLWVIVMPVLVAIAVLLAYVIAAPFLRRFAPALVRGAPERDVLPVTEAAPSSRAPVAPRAAEPALYRRIAVALEMGPADPAVLEHVHATVLSGETEVVLIHAAESPGGRSRGPR